MISKTVKRTDRQLDGFQNVWKNETEFQLQNDLKFFAKRFMVTNKKFHNTINVGLIWFEKGCCLYIFENFIKLP